MAEASEMSSMSSVSSVDSSAATPASGTEDNKMNKIFIVLVVVAVILLVAILAAAILPASASQKDGGDDGGSDGGKSDHGEYIAGGGGGGDGTTPATTKYVRRTTQEVITTSPTPDQFVPNPNPPLWPSPPAAGSQNDTVLCVVGQNQNTPESKATLPDDGLCDLTFYAHLTYLDGEFRGTDNTYSWTNFINVASQSSKTMYGFSINYPDANIFYDAVFGSGNQKSEMKTLYDTNKIMHYGFLQAYDSEDSLKSSAATDNGLGQLKAFSSMATSTWGASNTQIVVGVKFLSYETDTFNDKAKAIDDVVSNTGATILVLHTHASSWDSNDLPLCMTSWTYIRDRTKEPTLKDVGTDILSKATIGDDVTVMISFTMSVQIFKSDSTYHNSRDGFQATSFGWLPYEQMCIYVMPYDDLDTNADVYMSSLDDTFTLCAERSETLISKIKKWLAVVAPKKHGFAFFDLELDDLDNTCKKGSFYRIQQVKRYLRT